MNFKRMAPLMSVDHDRQTANPLFDALSIPLIQADRSEAIVYANAEAERLIAGGRGLVRAPDGRLRAEAERERGALRAVVGKACRGEGASILLSGSGAGGGGRLAVTAIPMPTGGQGGALLVVNDPERRPARLAERLRGLFGLSPAEAEVAVSLSCGDTLNEISGARGVTIKTLRKQVEAILAKTQTARQAQLVALIGRLAVLA
jgi:DNA-binding CsgD family transcriptional regulator